MSLSDLLKEKNIKNALIVDDVCDAVPTINDIDPGNEDWPTFNDDLLEEHRNKISKAYPPASDKPFDELIADNDYIAAVWNLRGELGVICEPVFATYIDDQASDQHHIDLAIEKLKALGLNCETSGRDFIDAAQTADLILIDLFFSKTQDDTALEESKNKLSQALETRRNNPPLVILMSRSHRLEAKRDEFRDDVGLLDSSFRIIRKADLEDTDRLERHLIRLAENSIDSRRLATFFCTVEDGMKKATESTLKLLRNLRLSDIGQIQQLLLNAEGQPTGSYLVDVFDRVLQHEIERDTGIIDAAIELNQFSTSSHPPPFVAGSPELQELVERLLTQNAKRLRLPGALEASVTFGDVLKISENVDIERLKSEVLVDLTPDKVLLVLTPACDLQRSGVPRILLLVGTAKLLNVQDWSYGNDARTPAIRIGQELYWIKWNLKHIDTVSHEQLNRAFQSDDLIIAARLREAHVLELQQRVLSGLGRVGMIATLPATFPVNVEAYYANTEGIPTRLEVPELAEGAVCFVGRDSNSAPALRLIMTDHCCDALTDAYAGIDERQVAELARQAFNHARTSGDFRHILTTGIKLKGAKDNRWTYIASITGQDANIPHMGLLAWNFQNSTNVLIRKDLLKAGIILLIEDREQTEAPDFETVVRSGLIQPEPDPT
ncbi:MAG: hypothetical protein JKY95_14235 [Planctomycetaceae bacterium]|nr:hypothetical protein [Planctomycetaceae bacterium]